MKELPLLILLIFVYCFFAFSIGFLYSLLYPRSCRGLHSSSAAASDEEEDLEQCSTSADVCIDPLGHGTKEFFPYLLCWKTQSRVDPSAATTAASTLVVQLEKILLEEPMPATVTGDVAELEKYHGMYASRMLFTIKEEEKEGSSGSEGRRSSGSEGTEIVSLFEEEEGSERGVAVAPPVTLEEEEDNGDEHGSLRFYTPPSSPPRPEEETAGGPQLCKYILPPIYS